MVTLLELLRNWDKGDLYELGFRVNGDIESGRSAQTTDATPRILKGVNALGSLFVPENCVVAVKLAVNGIITSTTTAGTPGSIVTQFSWWSVKNVAGTLTVQSVINGPDPDGAFSVRDSPDADNWTVTLIDNGTTDPVSGNYVDIQVQGDVDMTIDWSAIADQAYVRYL